MVRKKCRCLKLDFNPVDSIACGERLPTLPWGYPRGLWSCDGSWAKDGMPCFGTQQCKGPSVCFLFFPSRLCYRDTSLLRCSVWMPGF